MSWFANQMERSRNAVRPTFAEAQAATKALGGFPSRAAIAEWVTERRANPVREFAGISVSSTAVTYQGQSFPRVGATAAVETAGQVEVRDRTRLSVTRIAVLGVFALAAPKRKTVTSDTRELYLTVTGDGFEVCVSVDPDKGLQARQFAAVVNSTP